MFAKQRPWRHRRTGLPAVAEKTQSESSLEGALERLWLNVALPKEEFYLTYAPVVRAAMAAVDNDAQRKALYQRIRFALLASNGVIFGRTHGLDVEDSMVMSQAFAFATTVAIALETCSGDSPIDEAGEWHPGWALFKAQDVLSKEGWEWLTQYPPVFNDVLACFLAPERSEIKKLLETRPRNLVVEKSTKQSGGAAYLLWLKHKLTTKKILFNTPNANVHVLDGQRIFLIVPNAFQGYMAEKKSSSGAVKNSLKRLKVHEVVGTADANCEIFSAAVGGKKKKGMILCDARLLFDDVPLTSEYVVITDRGQH